MDAQDFDAWSKSYDESVLKQETYPFAGYDEIVEEVINQTNGRKVLDLGIGSRVIIMITAFSNDEDRVLSLLLEE